MNKTKISLIVTVSFLIVVSSSSSIFGYGGPPEQSSSGNYSVKVIFDRESYNVGEPIVISGNVNKFNEERTLKITIFDSTQNLVLNQKFSVNSDTSFSHEIIPDKEFLEGKYIVRAQYGTSKVTVEKTSFIITSNNDVSSEQKSVENSSIPDWVRSNAGWWAEGAIDDNSFVQGIQFMITEGLMRIPDTKQGLSSQDNSIPDWVRSNAGWWAEGAIDDNSFVQGIQFMITEGLMRIS